MTDQDRIDFSALDVDPVQWRAFTTATLSHVDGVLNRRSRYIDPLTLLSSWRRYILGAAASLIAVLVPVEFALELRETDREQIQTLVHVSSEAAWGVRQPTAAELLRVVGGERLP